MHQPVCPTSSDDSPTAVLYQQHAATILKYLRQQTRSWEDAEDVLVEVFLAALDAQNGVVQWKQQVNDPHYDIVSSCVLANDALFVVGGYPLSLQAYSGADGKPLWQMSLDNKIPQIWLIAAP
jgi:outer membrane protein assembly factor BamB